MSNTEPVEVVISGIGGIFPEADNIDELKKNLFGGVDMISVKNTRWNSGNNDLPTGKSINNRSFLLDNTFFGVNAKTASMMDPLNRSILETCFEAIIDSGNNPSHFSGQNIGVFANSDMMELHLDALANPVISGYVIMGTNKAMLANRISFAFNFKGTSCAYYNAWTGGMQVLKTATDQIHQGLIESALVVAGMIHTNPYSAGEIAGLATPLSPVLCTDGKCRSFDDEACGFPRSEAIVTFFLEKITNAKRNYGSIIHVDTFMYGSRECAFIELEQHLVTKSLKDFYKECKLDPSLVSYVEADGSAVKRVEKVELDSLAEVFCPNRTSHLPIGSVKSNLGHTESANSLVSLAKALIVMDSGMIPANLHFKTPNSEVMAFEKGKIKVVTEHEPLQSSYVAVNSISFCGSVGHLLLKQNPKVKSRHTADATNIPRLILTSARHEEGMDKVNDLLKSIPIDAEFTTLVNNVFKSNIVGHGYRSYTLASSDNEIIKQVKKEFSYENHPVWFIFSGMGSQWNGMGVGLMQLPVFAAAIDKCHNILEPLGVNLKYVLTSSDCTVFDNILNSFVGIAAVQIGLVDLLKSLGIVPDGMIGHSVGELGCAYADGCFTAEEMILSAYARGRASLDTPLIKGKMAAVGMGYNHIKNKLPPSIQVACHNSATSCTLSGPAEDVEEFVLELKKQKIFVATVNVANIAYHSRYIAPAAPILLEKLKEVIKVPKRRSYKWISSSVPEAEWGSEEAQYSSPEYHTNNLLGSVLFEEACRHIPEGAIAIEIAPHGLLQAILRRSLSVVNIPLTNKTAQCSKHFFLQSIGELYLNTLQPDLNAIYPPVEFPVSRETPCLAQLVTWAHTEHFTNINSYVNLKDTCNTIVLRDYYETNPLLYDYKMSSKYLTSTAQLLMIVWTHIINSNDMSYYNSVVFKDVYIKKQLSFLVLDKIVLKWDLSKGSGLFEIFASGVEGKQDDLIMSGFVTVDKEDVHYFERAKGNYKNTKPKLTINQEELYSFFKSNGYQLSNHLFSIKGIEVHEQECIGQIDGSNLLTIIESLLKINEYFATIDKISKDMLMTSYIRMIRINTNRPEYSENVKFVKKRNYNYTYCCGVEIHDLEFQKFTLEDTKSDLTVEKIEFIPLADNCDKMGQVFETILLLMKSNDLKNWASNTKDYVIYQITENSVTEYLTTQLKETSNNLNSFQVYSKSVNIEDLSSLTTPHMIITTAESLTVCVANSEVDLFLCQTPYNFVCKHKDVQPVIQFKLKDVLVTLFKKTKSFNIIVRDNVREADWISKLRDHLVTMNNADRIVLAWNNSSNYEMVNICKILAKEDISNRLSCFFILDEQAPKFTTSNSFYSRQISLSFAVNIYKDGSWGCANINTLAPDQQITSNHLFKISIKNLDTKYISINVNDSIEEQSKPLLEVKYIEYAGSTIDGKNVMGIAIYNQKKMTVETDKILQWTVPQAWSLEDAATVPVAYLTAYYALAVCAQTRKRETVLVTAGYTIMGEAAIAVALELDTDVITTVQNKSQALTLASKFPKLAPNQILCYNRNIDYDIIKTTNGKGVNVILNTMRGNIYQTFMRCLSKMSRFIQLSQTEMEKKDKLGLYNFFKLHQFYNINIGILFTMKESKKLELYEFLENGLKNNIVKPLTRNVFYAEETSLITRHVQEMFHLNKTVLSICGNGHSVAIQKKNPLNCFSNNSCIIIGDNDELCIDLIDWLIKQGAVNIVLNGSTVSSNGHMQYRMSQLFKIFGTTIIESSKEINNLIQARELLNNVINLGPLTTIFSIYMDNRCVGEGVRSLYSASQELESCRFVSICTEDYNNIPGISIKCGTERKEIIKYMQQLLDMNGYPTILLSKNDKDYSLEGLSQYLPTLEDLQNVGYNSERPFIHEVCTKSPRARHVKKCFTAWSIFIFPGVSYAAMKPLVRKLDYISYFVHLPTVLSTIEQTAAAVLEEILKTCDTRVYTFLIEMWAGTIATEVGKLLEARGKRVKLLLLNAYPSITLKFAKVFGPHKSPEFENNLLSVLLKLDINSNLEVMRAKTWKEKLQCAVKLQDNKDKLATSISAFYNLLTYLFTFKSSEMFQGDVFLLRLNNDNITHIDYNELVLYCRENFKSVVISDAVTYSDLMNSDITAKVINEQSNDAWI